MTPSHRREAYARAFRAVAEVGHRVTKRRYTGIPSGEQDHARWIVWPEGIEAKDVKSFGGGALGFETLESVERWASLQARARGIERKAEPEHQEEPERTPEPAPERKPAPGFLFPAQDGTPSLDATLATILQRVKPTADVDEAKVRAIAAEVVAEAVAKLDRPTEVVEVRELDRTREVDCKGEHAAFPLIVRELSLGLNVLAAGPSGSGKTTAIERAAAKLGMALFLVPPPSDPFEIFGYRDANGAYQDTPVWRAVHHDGPALLLFDEIDRSDPRALCAAHTVLAGNGLVSFPHAQVPMPENLRIAATANTWGVGPDAEYVGANKLDGATLNRFASRLFVDYDTALERNLAKAKHGGTDAAVDLAQRIRAKLTEHGIRIPWTPRDTFALCRRMAAGVPQADALNASVLATLRDDQRRRVLA